MIDYLQAMLAERGLAPHGYCLLWDPRLIWTHVISDLLIGLAYFSIPLAIARFLTLRRDVKFGWVIWLFAAFIMACGLTHFLSILVLWVPAYGIEGLVKALTAVVSVVTAVALWPLLPKAIALPSPAQLEAANVQLRESIAERDTALAALSRESEERARAEDMLRQAQKMEAVGQLTGGVAHDFNNLLMIVSGNLERLQRQVAGQPAAERSVSNAIEGAERAAKLTNQLLAFSRRQPLQPQVHDLNAIVTNMVELIERTLGPNVRVSLDLDANAKPVVLDVSQTENAILNLAINARDAMPDGGDLTLRTRGTDDAVMISVIDTGIGMSADVVERVFEPFFTTKPVGSGTGLGLSQVYGFSRQTGGDVTITSVPGAGTTVTITLPTAETGEKMAPDG